MTDLIVDETKKVFDKDNPKKKKKVPDKFVLFGEATLEEIKAYIRGLKTSRE